MTHTLKTFFGGGLLFMAACLTGCRMHYAITSIEGGRIVIDSVYDAHADSEAVAVFEHYARTVDSIMAPVIGHSAKFMDRYRPESELSNLVADMLRVSTTDYIGREADVAIINMGGLRTSLPEGSVTFGNIFEITPFENSLCIVPMKGDVLLSLFGDLAKNRGEGLSGARLVITADGELVSALVNGQPIDTNAVYTVATVDYVAEGNDRLYSFKQVPAEQRNMPDGATLRQLFLNYVVMCEREGKLLDSKLDGRITIKK